MDDDSMSGKLAFVLFSDASVVVLRRGTLPPQPLLLHTCSMASGHVSR